MSDPIVTPTLEDIPKIIRVLEHSREYAYNTYLNKVEAARAEYERLKKSIDSALRETRDLCTHPEHAAQHGYIEIGPYEYQEYTYCSNCEDYTWFETREDEDPDD